MLQQVEEYDKNEFSNSIELITKQNKPVIIRGLVDFWPAVAKGKQSGETFARYLRSYCNGFEAPVILLPPHANGRVSYENNFTSFNFERRGASISAAIKQLINFQHGSVQAPSLAIQSAPVMECLPKFLIDNPSPSFLSAVKPRIWIGNKVIVPAHYDDAHNIACVVSGRRKFTLLPPEQIDNLYIGPIDNTPTGPAISLVDFNAPDFEKFPKFKQALKYAVIADLAPGDAIYIPPLWWHHVESLGDINTLINYWWGGAIDIDSERLAPTDSLIHSILSIKDLPENQRKVWKKFFDHYVFRSNGDPVAHLPKASHGILGAASPEQRDNAKEWLINNLKVKK